MEKRNFVTSARTPGGTGASDIDEILDAGVAAFGKGRVKSASDSSLKRKYEEKASKIDEICDK